MKVVFVLILSLGWAMGVEYVEPASLQVGELAEFEGLSEERQKVIRAALEIRAKNGWLKYQFGSADPEKGGFDCSGAMFYLFRSLGYEISRSSADQYLWVQEKGKLVKVGAEVVDLKDEVFCELRPGDLVFWSGTYEPTDGRKVAVTHVGLYLGTEKKDGRAVMICSSAGRSYRGKAGDGYGVFDFRVPRKASKSKLVAFGSPPGVDGGKE